MREVVFVLAGTGPAYAGGGLWAELRAYELVRELVPARVVTWQVREPDHPFLDDVVPTLDPRETMLVVSWSWPGANVLERAPGHNVIYHAHSVTLNHRFTVPPTVPILAVSRYTAGYWGRHAPESPIYLLPNEIPDAFSDRGEERDIDVLVLARKSSRYLMETLVPALAERCRVEVVREHVDDLAALYNRAKVYLYDSTDHWIARNVTEGFGLQPVEALACGCTVFSSVNSGLFDVLDPGLNCHKLRTHSLEYDRSRILESVERWPERDAVDLTPYRRGALLARLEVVLGELNAFFDHAAVHAPDIPPFRPRERGWRSVLRRLRRRLPGG